MIASIAEKKEIPLARFIYALGIRNIGAETAVDLADQFGSLEKLKDASLEDFEKGFEVMNNGESGKVILSW